MRIARKRSTIIQSKLQYATDTEKFLPSASTLMNFIWYLPSMPVVLAQVMNFLHLAKSTIHVNLYNLSVTLIKQLNVFNFNTTL